MMNRFIFLIGLSVLFIYPARSQKADHINGGHFSKKVEYNTSSGVIMIDENGNKIPSYNVNSKTPLEKVFFGLTNSPIEYIVTSREGQAGLRLYKERPNAQNWKLEVFPLGDYEMAVRAIKRETEKIEIPLWFLGRLPHEYQEQVREHNKQAPLAAINEETYKPYRPETKVFTLRHLGDSLYNKMVALIDGFRSEGISGVIAGGHSVTFRCVVGDEVWTLAIHIPQQKALQMSNLCRQIIEDVMKGDKFDEWKYVRLLEPIEF